MHPSTNQRGECLETATAISLRFAALNKQQRWAHTERGNSWGMCASILAASDDVQDWSAIGRAGFTAFLNVTLLLTGRGFGSGPFFQFSFAREPVSRLSDKRALWGGFLPRTRGARTHSQRGLVCRPTVRQSLTHEQAIQAVAHVSHHQDLSLTARFRPDQFGRRHDAWRYQILSMRCPK